MAQRSYCKKEVCRLEGPSFRYLGQDIRTIIVNSKTRADSSTKGKVAAPLEVNKIVPGRSLDGDGEDIMGKKGPAFSTNQICSNQIPNQTKLSNQVVAGIKSNQSNVYYY
jgi:hypothetical protein